MYLNRTKKLRIEFLEVHKEELKFHFISKALRDHIQQGEDNLRSASEATREVMKHELSKAYQNKSPIFMIQSIKLTMGFEAIVNLAMRAAAEKK